MVYSDRVELCIKSEIFLFTLCPFLHFNTATSKRSHRNGSVHTLWKMASILVCLFLTQSHLFSLSLHPTLCSSLGNLFLMTWLLFCLARFSFSLSLWLHLQAHDQHYTPPPFILHLFIIYLTTSVPSNLINTALHKVLCISCCCYLLPGIQSVCVSSGLSWRQRKKDYIRLTYPAIYHPSTVYTILFRK